MTARSGVEQTKDAAGPGSESRLSTEERMLKVLASTGEQRAAIDRILEGGLGSGGEGPQAGGREREPYITKREVARLLSRDVRTVATWMQRGLLPYYKIGRTVAFKWSEVEQQLAARCRVGRVA